MKQDCPKPIKFFIQTECDRKHLFCTFDTKKHPYFKINSVKLEILSWDPYVVLLHKAIPTEFFEYTWGTTVSLSIVNSTVPKSSLRLEKSGTPLEKAVQKSISPRNGVTHRIHPSPNKVSKSIVVAICFRVVIV